MIVNGMRYKGQDSRFLTQRVFVEGFLVRKIAFLTSTFPAGRTFSGILFVLALLPLPCLADAQPPSALQHWYLAGDVKEVNGKNNGTIVGETVWIVNRVGRETRAIQFDSSTAHVKLHASPLPGSGKQFAITLWYRQLTNDKVDRQMMYGKDADGEVIFGLGLNNGQLYVNRHTWSEAKHKQVPWKMRLWEIKNRHQPDLRFPRTPFGWNFIALVQEASKMRVYHYDADEKLTARTNYFRHQDLGSVAEWGFGSPGGDVKAVDALSDVRTFSVALTSRQVNDMLVGAGFSPYGQSDRYFFLENRRHSGRQIGVFSSGGGKFRVELTAQSADGTWDSTLLSLKRPRAWEKGTDGWGVLGSVFRDVHGKVRIGYEGGGNESSPVAEGGRREKRHFLWKPFWNITGSNGYEYYKLGNVGDDTDLTTAPQHGWKVIRILYNPPLAVWQTASYAVHIDPWFHKDRWHSGWENLGEMNDEREGSDTTYAQAWQYAYIHHPSQVRVEDGATYVVTLDGADSSSRYVILEEEALLFTGRKIQRLKCDSSYYPLANPRMLWRADYRSAASFRMVNKASYGVWAGFHPDRSIDMGAAVPVLHNSVATLAEQHEITTFGLVKHHNIVSRFLGLFRKDFKDSRIVNHNTAALIDCADDRLFKPYFGILNNPTNTQKSHMIAVDKVLNSGAAFTPVENMGYQISCPAHNRSVTSKEPWFSGGTYATLSKSNSGSVAQHWVFEKVDKKNSQGMQFYNIHSTSSNKLLSWKDDKTATMVEKVHKDKPRSQWYIERSVDVSDSGDSQVVDATSSNTAWRIFNRKGMEGKSVSWGGDNRPIVLSGCHSGTLGVSNAKWNSASDQDWHFSDTGSAHHELARFEPPPQPAPEINPALPDSDRLDLLSNKVTCPGLTPPDSLLPYPWGASQDSEAGQNWVRAYVLQVLLSLPPGEDMEPPLTMAEAQYLYESFRGVSCASHGN